FERPTTRTPSECATWLRHAPAPSPLRDPRGGVKAHVKRVTPPRAPGSLPAFCRSGHECQFGRAPPSRRPPGTQRIRASTAAAHWRTGCIVSPPGGLSMANTSGETAATIEVEAREQGLNDAPRADRTPESLADLFAPDVVLPEQFFEGARRDSQA